ncbi:MAG: Uncharacterized protein XD61_1324 [Thermococcus sp. 40_45]|nr:MAG: Uncharacterized protein XD61_1324 [Thermococcus sp. 40_45]
MLAFFSIYLGMKLAEIEKSEEEEIKEMKVLTLTIEISFPIMKGKKMLLPALLAVVALGWIVGWVTNSGKSELALIAFALTAIFVNLYFSYLEKKGFILEDERTLRINEIASRRTLQITSISLAVAMLLLSGKLSDPKMEGAFLTVGLVLAVMLTLHLLFRHYYSRVI